MTRYEELLKQYREQFADYTLTEVGLGIDPLRAFKLRKPGWSGTEDVDLLFTSGPMDERTAITGDLCPNDNQGCTSNLRLGLGWFAGNLSADYLCSKFFRTTWVPEIALEAMRGMLADERSEAGEGGIDDETRAIAVARIQLLEEVIKECEEAPEHNEPTHTAEAFNNWYWEMFKDMPETRGFGYDTRDKALLVTIQATFSRLYWDAQTKAYKAREVWGYASSREADGYAGAFGSRDEAIQAARAHYASQEAIDDNGVVLPEFYVVKGHRPDAGTFVPSARHVCDEMENRACDEHDIDIVKDWPSLTPVAIAELGSLLKAWARKHAPCTFWEVDGEPERIDNLLIEPARSTP